MAEPVFMLALSPTMEEGRIMKWNKKEGESIAEGDILCEVETDKASMDYESQNEGILLKILLSEGKSAKIGQAIGIIGENGENISSLLKDLATKDSKPASSSQKTNQNSHPSSITSEVKDEASKEKTSVQSGKIKVSPLARKIAEENGLQLHHVSGTGPQGRIIKRDIEKALSESSSVMISSMGPGSTEEIEDRMQARKQDRIIEITQKRRIIATRLSESKYSSPHYYLKVSVNMDLILSARSELNRKRSEKVSLNAFLLTFIAQTLKKHTRVNAGWEGNQIREFAHIDLGIAVAQDDGLITPIVRNCGEKGLLKIESELKTLIEKARANKLTPEEYQGATFTISSLGSFGIEEFTAIINPPGSAILAIGAIQKTPVVDEENQIQIRSQMKLSLSCDHRIIDGVIGARFLYDLKNSMEDPIRILY